MAKFIVMVGNVGSGKSTYAKELEIKYRAVVIESDAVRELLFPNPEFTKEEHEQVFNEVHNRIRHSLEWNIPVVFDATNINRDRRIELLNRFKWLYNEAICYFINTPLKECIRRNSLRDRKVPEEVIRRYATQIQIPYYEEGWHEIYVV